MDDDLDDLFGDSAPLQLSIPLSQSLVSRLNESSLYGCCQCVIASELCRPDPKNGSGRLPGQSSVLLRTLLLITMV